MLYVMYVDWVCCEVISLTLCLVYVLCCIRSLDVLFLYNVASYAVCRALFVVYIVFVVSCLLYIVYAVLIYCGIWSILSVC